MLRVVSGAWRWHHLSQHHSLGLDCRARHCPFLAPHTKIRPCVPSHMALTSGNSAAGEQWHCQIFRPMRSPVGELTLSWGLHMACGMGALYPFLEREKGRFWNPEDAYPGAAEKVNLNATGSRTLGCLLCCCGWKWGLPELPPTRSSLFMR